jgi:hypothetical protein
MMASQTRLGHPPPATDPSAACLTDHALGDLRFRALLSEDDWRRLPVCIRRRFSRRLADGQTTVYVGTMVKAWFSRLGFVLAHAARFIGGPLPVGRDVDVPFIVTVTEEMATGGQIWTRICTRRRRFPQVIHSSKRFAGPTGLEEYIGFGISVGLTTLVDTESLRFRSAGYGRGALLPVARLGNAGGPDRRAYLGNGEFVFSLELVHPMFGLLIDQAAVFRESAAPLDQANFH